MKYAPLLALGFIVSLGAAPALAQMGTGGVGNAMGGPAPTPQEATPDVPPPALPGAGDTGAAPVGPQVSKPISGDPTQALFAAVNKGDYGAAQSAIASGANLNATDQFGETPLDLSVALNRNNITFLLLGTRNELAGTQNEPVGSPWLLNAPSPSITTPHHHHAVEPEAAAAPAYGASSATPNPSAGFLGFGGKN